MKVDITFRSKSVRTASFRGVPEFLVEASVLTSVPSQVRAASSRVVPKCSIPNHVPSLVRTGEFRGFAEPSILSAVLS